MKKLLTPTWTINSIYAIKPDDLLRHDIKAIICDLDNTLIAWNQWEHTEEMAEWLTRFKDAGIGIYLLSNNNYDRVLKVAEPLELRFTSSALKPRRKHFVLAIEDLQVPDENVAVIGDQVMTDVIGANRNHLKSILVKPIAPNDNIFTIINRMLEKIAFKIVGIDRTGDWGNTLE
ncbi:MAG TPA: YqeG family HAD IIIA-type phosphatase [Facklamia tabacinasalis]|nr:YqeG family HAD IIIA-type phosphatase [Ruoffia tabacinasalis]